MARLRRDDESRRPEHSIVVTDADGVPVRDVVSGPRRALPPSAGWRLGAVVVVVMVFALGIVIGRGTIHVQTGRAAIAPTSRSAHPTTSPSDRPTPSSTATSDPQQTAGTDQQWGAPTALIQVPGECDQMKYVASVGYVAPLPEPVDMTIFAGSPPRLYDLKDGTVGPPLFQPRDHESVVAIAADGHGLVVATRACTDPMSVKIERIAGDGTATRVEIPTGWRPSGNLTVVDGRAWAVLFKQSGGTSGQLLATDGSGDTAPMPKDSDDGLGTTSPDGARRVTRVLNTDGTAGYHLEMTDVATGSAIAVPGIVLGAAGASVAFSPDSTGLVVAVPTLLGGRLLLYGPDGLDGPYSINTTIPGEQIPIFIRGT